MKLILRSLLSALLFTIFSAAPVAYAQPQDADAARWYRVELMIFSRPEAATSRAEIWEPEPNLAYPDNFRYLINPATVIENLEANPGESTVDPLGVQTILLPAEVPPEEQTPDIPSVEGPNVPDPNSQAKELDPALLEDEELEPEPLTPSSFIVRPSGELEFRGKAAYMQRTGRFRTLFHQTWLQPMASADETLPIIIDRSGDIQDWPLLQGSVKLYVSRYLHLETNLWLNTQGQYFTENWRIPAPPLSPASLILVTPPSAFGFDMDPAIETEPEIPTAAMREDLPENGIGYGADDFEGLGVDTPEPEDLEPAYPWRHAVLMQQKRRMRSNEVHYIDHPMLGVVIKVTPLSAEELEEMALAEIALAEQAAAAQLAE
ncbi:MAG: CsiV family protein [Halioglobus sp.]